MEAKIKTRKENFSDWYNDLVIRSGLADYSPVKGCMVIKPHGYAVWESIQRIMDARFKRLGVQNCYFPLLIPESFLKKESEHVEGFAPQCAVVTYAGSKDLEEKYVIRPTSETIINSMFAKWIQGYRDLPLIVNQWANVVRWEMRTRLFLRTTEFLWQEGHTCHATKEEAEEETSLMLKMYKEFAEDTLAMPVISGTKTQNEKFAGADKTLCIEAMMQDKRALQAGTSHNLGQNFAKSFGTKFLDKNGVEQFVHQTSWGVSTRLIGALVMTHSDDQGLVLPPRVAPYHIVIVPIFKDKDKEKVVTEATELYKSLCEYFLDNSPWKDVDIAVKIDTDDSKTPGWKFNEYELKGIPLRIEMGSRDIEKGQVVIARRDNRKKTFSAYKPVSGLAQTLSQLLIEVQKDLFEASRKRRDESIFLCDNYNDFKKNIDEPGGFYLSHWCGDTSCELAIKDETKATIRCIPLDNIEKDPHDSGSCIRCGKASQRRVIFAKNY